MKNALCIIAYLPVFIVTLDTVTITQFQRRISRVPNFNSRGKCFDMRHLNQQFQIKYDFAESATECSRKFDIGSTFDLDVAFHMCRISDALIIETLIHIG